jgi:putative solute:sodium symporter small subunit
MLVTELEVHYYIVTIGFPTIFFLLIVLYVFYRGRHKRQL